MRLTIKELIELLIALDSTIDYHFNDKNERFKEKLCIKLSKEISGRGYSNIVADSWIEEEKKNETKQKQ